MRLFKTCKLPEHFPVAWRSFSACSEPSVNMHWTWAAKSQQTQESWRTSQAWLCRVHGEHRKGEVHVGLLFLSVKPLHASSGVNRHNADSSRRNMEHRRRDWKRGEWKTWAWKRIVSLFLYSCSSCSISVRSRFHCRFIAWRMKIFLCLSLWQQSWFCSLCSDAEGLQYCPWWITVCLTSSVFPLCRKSQSKTH